MSEVESKKSKITPHEWRAIAITFQMSVTFVLMVLALESLVSGKLILNRFTGIFLLIITGMSFSCGSIICFLPLIEVQKDKK